MKKSTSYTEQFAGGVYKKKKRDFVGVGLEEKWQCTFFCNLCIFRVSTLHLFETLLPSGCLVTRGWSLVPLSRLWRITVVFVGAVFLLFTPQVRVFVLDLKVVRWSKYV